MMDIFSTREIVSAFYILLFFTYSICKKQTRKIWMQVVKCAMKVKLAIPFLLLILYTAIFVYFFTYLPFWDAVYLKDIVFWVIFVGVPYCYNAASDGEKDRYFFNAFKDNLKFVALMEFVTGTFTFKIGVELLLQPFITILVIGQSLTKDSRKKRIWDTVLGIVGIAILVYTVKAALGIYANINPIDTVVSFCIPIMFSILFIPCAYLLALVAKYETLYIKWGFKESKERKIRRKRHIVVFFTCGLSYKKLCAFYKAYVQRVNVQMTQQNFEEIIKDFKLTYKQKRGQVVMESNKEKRVEWNWGSAKFNAIIAIIGCIGTLVGAGVSLYSLSVANEALQVVGDIRANNIGTMNNVGVINHNGLNAEDVDFIAKDNYMQMMDKAYEAENVFRMVNENPNLHFSLVWSGTEEEHEKTNWEEMPPHVLKLISRE